MTNWYFGEKKHFREKNICNGYKIFVTVTKIFFCNERLPTPISLRLNKDFQVFQAFSSNLEPVNTVLAC